MKTFHVKRLLKLANHLYSEPKNFDFSFISRETPCGTVACGLGQCVSLFRRYCKFVRYDLVGKIIVVGIREYRGLENRMFAEKFFSLTKEEVNDIFFNFNDIFETTYGCSNYQVTSNMVGDKIVKLLSSKGVKVKKELTLV